MNIILFFLSVSLFMFCSLKNKHAPVASFNNSESQLEITKASNQQDLDLSDEKEN